MCQVSRLDHLDQLLCERSVKKKKTCWDNVISVYGSEQRRYVLLRVFVPSKLMFQISASVRWNILLPEFFFFTTVLNFRED